MTLPAGVLQSNFHTLMKGLPDTEQAAQLGVDQKQSFSPAPARPTAQQRHRGAGQERAQVVEHVDLLMDSAASLPHDAAGSAIVDEEASSDESDSGEAPPTVRLELG